jgi:hypothetical protein
MPHRHGYDVVGEERGRPRRRDRFSPKAIEAARDLSKELRIETEFVE